ncbi:MAG: PTS sugar transporter subunit IIA [Endozoicomonas sp. (ex Botrylloides leachii)]|nr:PTS sugar transporter subunit IIA [Endozoicomonas sp. (ex Botrylloides leachii)]
MIIKNILTPARTLCSVRGSSKKKVLELIATAISEEIPAISGKALFSSLISRERLGTTGIGDGIAIPHCRTKYCTEPIGLFIQFAEPIDFEATDHKPVDLVFALIVPEESSQQHLDILKALVGRFQTSKLLAKLRGASNSAELYDIITSDA